MQVKVLTSLSGAPTVFGPRSDLSQGQTSVDELSRLLISCNIYDTFPVPFRTNAYCGMEHNMGLTHDLLFAL
jgi:hypothetical protein